MLAAVFIVCWLQLAAARPVIQLDFVAENDRPVASVQYQMNPNLVSTQKVQTPTMNMPGAGAQMPPALGAPAPAAGGLNFGFAPPAQQLQQGGQMFGTINYNPGMPGQPAAAAQVAGSSSNNGNTLQVGQAVYSAGATQQQIPQQQQQQQLNNFGTFAPVGASSNNPTVAPMQAGAMNGVVGGMVPPQPIYQPVGMVSPGASVGANVAGVLGSGLAIASASAGSLGVNTGSVVIGNTGVVNAQVGASSSSAPAPTPSPMGGPVPFIPLNKPIAPGPMVVAPDSGAIVTPPKVSTSTTTVP